MLSVVSAATMGAAGSILSEWLSQRKSVPEITIEKRLERLSETMGESAKLLEQVSAEIDLRRTTAEKLLEDAKHAERLAQLNAEQREEVARLVRAEIRDESKRSFWKGVGVNFLFFVAGALVSLSITLFVS